MTMDPSDFRSQADDYVYGSDDDRSLEDVEDVEGGVYDNNLNTRDGLMHEDSVEKEVGKRSLCRYQRCICRCLVGTIGILCFVFIVLMVGLLADVGLFTEDDVESQTAMQPHHNTPYQNAPSIGPPLNQPSTVADDAPGPPTPAPVGTWAPTSVFQSSLPKFTQEALRYPFSPQSKALVWATGHPEWSTMAEWRKLQLLAMASFYYAYQGDLWTEEEKKHWLDYTTNECQWGSYPNNFNECTVDSRIMTLRIESQGPGVTGITPLEMTLIPTLEKFEMFSMHLKTEFETIIPSQMAMIPGLQRIRLAGSQITGTLPPYISHFGQLTSLAFSNNDMVGPIPTEIGLLTNLKYLTMDDNNLSGTIPSQLALLTNLESLSLFGNHFNGHVPYRLCTMPSLIKLEVDCQKNFCPRDCDCICKDSTRKRGTPTPTTAPRTFDATPYPTHAKQDIFVLGLPQHTLDNMNKFNAPQFQAYGWLMQHPQLEKMSEWRKQQLFGLVTFFEAFTGSWDMLERFQWLDFNVNECDWSLGTCDSKHQFLAVWLDNLEDVQGNAIPLEISMMSHLESIALRGLGLKAELASFLPMTSLEMLPLVNLELQANQLSGSIPVDISSLRYLRNLSLARNNLNGTIPTELAKLTDLVQLSLRNNPGLTGSIPTEFAQLSQLEVLLLDGTSMTGTVPVEVCSPPSLKTVRINCDKMTCPTGCSCLCQSNEAEKDFAKNP